MKCVEASIIRPTATVTPTPTARKSTLNSQVSESIYKARATSLWPLATVAGAELHHICINKTSYEYAGGGGS